MKSPVAADLRQIFTATDRVEAEQRLKDFVQKYEKIAPRLSEWAEENIPEGLTVFLLPVAHQKRPYSSDRQPPAAAKRARNATYQCDVTIANSDQHR